MALIPTPRLLHQLPLVAWAHTEDGEKRNHKPSVALTNVSLRLQVLRVDGSVSVSWLVPALSSPFSPSSWGGKARIWIVPTAGCPSKPLGVVTHRWSKYGLLSICHLGRWGFVFHCFSEFWDGSKRAGLRASLIQEYLDLTSIGKIKYFHTIQLYSLGFYSGTKS